MEQHQDNTPSGATAIQARISNRAQRLHYALNRLEGCAGECNGWLTSIMELAQQGQTNDKAWLGADESADALCDEAQDFMRLAAAAYEAALRLREAVRDAECAAADAADKAAGGAL